MDDLVSTLTVYSAVDLALLNACTVESDLLAYSRERDEKHITIKPGINPLRFTISALNQRDFLLCQSLARKNQRGELDLSNAHSAAFVLSCIAVANVTEGSLSVIKPTLDYGAGKGVRKVWNEAPGDEFEVLFETIGDAVIQEIGGHIYERAQLGKRYRGTVPYAVPQSLALALAGI